MGRTEKILSQRKGFRSDNMIFVTLGTHEQPFDRLIGEINHIIEKNIITEDFFVQVGYRYNIIPNCKIIR